MLPVNFGPFITSLKLLLANRDQLTTAPGPTPSRSTDSTNITEPRNAAWWLAYFMIVSLGTAVGGSADRQLLLGRDPTVIPLLLDTLRWSGDTYQDDTMTTHIICTLYKAVARVPKENGSQIYNHPGGVQLLLDYIHKTTHSKNTATINSPLEDPAWGMALMSIMTALQSSRSVVISAEVQQQLWRIFTSLVAIFESPQASTLPFDNAIGISNFFHSIITLHVHPLEPSRQLQWILQCCVNRGPQDVPYLTIMSDLQSKNGLLHIKFPPSFMQKIYDFCDMHLENIHHLLTSLQEGVKDLSSEWKHQHAWVMMKITSGSMLSKMMAMVTGDRCIDSRASNPIPEGPKKISGGDGEVCGNPACFNHQNLKSCGRCRKVYYCGSYCQKQHWGLHKSKCT